MVNELCNKISNSFLFLFANGMLVNRAGIRKMLVRIANWEDPDQTMVFTVCLGLFGRQLVFKNIYLTTFVCFSVKKTHLVDNDKPFRKRFLQTKLGFPLFLAM